MAERSRGIGRGLAAILAAAPAEPETELRELPIELISPNPQQPRHSFDEGALVALAESVKDRGVLQPVLVRPLPEGRYELIAGERRWRAAQLAGLDTVPAIVRPRADAQSLELALIENMAREDLNPVDEARACAALIDELGLTREEVGRRVGRSRAAISNLVRLLELPDEALELLERGMLSEGHGRALLMAPDHATRRRLARQAHDQGWSVRQAESKARGAGDPPAAAAKRSPEGEDVHPDQWEAAVRLAESFGRALGVDVKVRPRGTGYSLQLAFESLDEGLDVLERLGVAPAAAAAA